MGSAITLEAVSKDLSGRHVLTDVGFAVETGDIFGCLGPNGAGKTTTIRIILGLLRPTAGAVRVLGHDPMENEVRNRVGFLLEADGLYDDLSAWDNLAYYGRLYGVRDPGPRIEAVLVLDEPTAGLDPGGQLEVRRMLLDLKERGTTIFLSSHNLDEMQRLCNRIVLIHGGRIRLYGELDELARGSGRRGAVIETTEPLAADILAGLERETGAAVEARDGATVTLSGAAGFDVPAVVAYLVGRGARIEQVTKQQDSLEDLYVRIEQEARAAEAAAPRGAAGPPRSEDRGIGPLPKGWRRDLLRRAAGQDRPGHGGRSDGEGRRD